MLRASRLPPAAIAGLEIKKKSKSKKADPFERKKRLFVGEICSEKDHTQLRRGLSLQCVVAVCTKAATAVGEEKRGFVKDVRFVFRFVFLWRLFSIPYLMRVKEILHDLRIFFVFVLCFAVYRVSFTKQRDGCWCSSIVCRFCFLR